MKPYTIGFIGGGRITKIFLQAFENKNVRFESIMVNDCDENILANLKSRFPEIEPVESLEQVSRQQILVLAVHPPVMMDVMKQIKNSISKETIVLSLAPKITLEKMEILLGTKRLVRMIPNASSYINKGYNPMAFHAEFDKASEKSLKKIVKALGKNFIVEEKKLEAYAIVSAMLPTYFWFQWEELMKLAGEMGLDEKEAQKSTKTSLKRTISMFFDAGLDVEDLKDLIPVKPIGEAEKDISEIYQTKLLGLYNKIKTG